MHLATDKIDPYSTGAVDVHGEGSAEGEGEDGTRSGLEKLEKFQKSRIEGIGFSGHASREDAGEVS